ncbi:mitogen-activated protein kinase kinase kinase [Salvia divinorum]|uniref:Mitogen-activated protein kinase kinase kinase n=1 Tax=Salvia divinorum TaxID=28513 RepID=A0ABD1HIJ2_SALDI
MSAIYDNWEKLVAAVLKKEQLWQLFNSDSVSISSDSSGFSFCNLTSSLDDVPFAFAAKSFPRIHVEEPIKNVTSKPARKRDFKIQVPEFRFQDVSYISECRWKVSPRMESPSVSPRSGGKHSMSQTKQQSYALPLPPGATSKSPPVSPTIPAVKSLTPKRDESVKSTWKKGKLIGRSTSGNVYLGFNSEKGEMCAMKEARLLPNEDMRRDARILEKEIALLSRMKHPNIVQYFGSELVGDNFYVYLEYVSGGSIHAILQEYGKLGESAIRNYTQQIVAGLAYLHSEHIVHGNIKAASILVDPNGAVKLTNFIIEMNMAWRPNSSSLMDSPYWMAPEVIMNSNVRKPASDIWSLGCTVLEMATSKPPLSQYKGVMAMFKVSCQNELPTIPDHLSDVCKDFLRCCLQLNPLHRAMASQLLEHPFVKSSSPLGKHMLASQFSDHPVVTNAVQSEDSDCGRSLHLLDSGEVVLHSSTASFRSSDIYSPKYVSAPVSPVGSPLLHPTSPQQFKQPKSPPVVTNAVKLEDSDCGRSLHLLDSGKVVVHSSTASFRSSDIYTPRYVSAPVSPVGSPLLHPTSPQQFIQPKSPPAESSPSMVMIQPPPHLNQTTWLKQGDTSSKPSVMSSPTYWDPNILQAVFRFS